MFHRKSTTTPDIDIPINALIAAMSEIDPDTDEYAMMVEQLVKLYKLKEVDASKRVSADTLAIVAANLAGIMMIVGHERAHVVTTKAIGFVQKLR